ncbi:3213_t:CDS:2 [Entrophospora sp. SA101]|nr:12979_t:CDS:2 [Entrophospora sp. SA101]CAJ0826235.1 3213_t:CDS:2 [Entrophospora sp. SA101]CAJ0833863.1 2757_t:CDS:2 [Entrophospora sp. SA101]CAJ0833873.1 2761_t:CDS:2 [Entrophospora sp. SA101]CAJ0833881.1 2764_t:CDS:2 [Entrophospora sp. SA101]
MSDKEGKTLVPIIPGIMFGRKGHISIPNILGLSNPENVNYLRAAEIQKYPDTFINFTDKRILENEKKPNLYKNK